MKDKKSRENEVNWVENKLKPILEDLFIKNNLSDKYKICTHEKLYHAISLNKCDIEDKSIKINEYSRPWDIDVCIKEIIEEIETGKKIEVPRVVIEVKYKKINTHDPITYNYKLGLHKNLYPGLRYGILIGNYEAKNCEIPERLITYGDNFDFMFVFNEDDLKNKNKIDKLFEVIKKNLDDAKILEDFLIKPDDRDNYWCIARNVEFNGKDNQ